MSYGSFAGQIDRNRAILELLLQASKSAPPSVPVEVELHCPPAIDLGRFKWRINKLLNAILACPTDAGGRYTSLGGRCRLRVKYNPSGVIVTIQPAGGELIGGMTQRAHEEEEFRKYMEELREQVGDAPEEEAKPAARTSVFDLLGPRNK